MCDLDIEVLKFLKDAAKDLTNVYHKHAQGDAAFLKNNITNHNVE